MSTLGPSTRDRPPSIIILRKTINSGFLYRNMNPIDANRDTQKNIQTPTPDGNDHVNTNKGGSDTNQENGDNRRHMKGGNQENRGDNQQSTQH